MKFIKVKDVDGKEVIINLAKVYYFYSITKYQTSFCFGSTHKDYLIVPMSIETFHQCLNSMDDTSKVWDFTYLQT